jgi:hypothetical protein
MSALSDIIRDRLSALGMRQVDLGIALGHKSEVMVAHVLAGRKAIPPEHIDVWADALRLHAEQRRAFWWAAALGSIPEPTRAAFEQVLSEHQTIVTMARDMASIIMPESSPGDLDAIFANLADPDATRAAWARMLRRGRRRDG